MKKYLMGFICGLMAMILWIYVSPKLFGKVYMVKSVSSHYPHHNENTQTTLIVYERGDSGHVKEVLCIFPPDFKLEGNEEKGWSGIKKVRIKGAAERFMFNQVGYYAEKVE